MMEKIFSKKLLAVSIKIAEGENKNTIDKIGRAIEQNPGVVLLDFRIRPEYNYTIIKFVGTEKLIFPVLDTVSELIFQLIDFSNSSSGMRSVGALSSVILIPIGQILKDECDTLLSKYAESFSQKFNQLVLIVPPNLRNETSDFYSLLHSWKPTKIETKINSGDLKPDFGGGLYNKKRGITLMRAQKYIISMIFHLDTSDLEIAQKIADDIGKQGRILYDKKGEILKDKNGKFFRHKGYYDNVSSVSGNFTSDEVVQVLCNVEDYENPTLFALYNKIKSVAEKFVVEVPGCNILGFIPFDAIRAAVASSPNGAQNERLNYENQINIFTDLLNMREFGQFNPQWQIIENKFSHEWLRKVNK